jgi:hypothetical protein
MTMATLHQSHAAPAVLSVLSRFDRQSLASFITVAIDLLDVVDGDTDAELNGDEEDGTDAEDELSRFAGRVHAGPGCSISDPDAAVDDHPCDEPYQDLEPEESI